ncbi:hypothetical protein [Asticcacaulis excentricus]|uniref:Uncharacterized protein n=1 Tax=Asticcacaulis excentricus (strain ATCC 15261 / DSM 4724 / KCTC 12464 / NCIMB 9791 / VKM B-1370 / CB 48) TaxID=573065 RepID=E8RVU5_ASTEC|nr:hypothetical protein [Asticcacaulis excentricus]ADU15367.1 hypothetical protein Astex_3756 [Asticcacaulis excentricus CB 48]
MIKTIDLSRNATAAAAQADQALGLLRETPDKTVLITASNGQVAIDSAYLTLALDLFHHVLQSQTENSAHRRNALDELAAFTQAFDV